MRHEINGGDDDGNPTHHGASWGLVPQVSKRGSESELDEGIELEVAQAAPMLVDVGLMN